MSIPTKLSEPQLADRPDAASFSYLAAIIIVSAVAMTATLPGRTVGLGMITERLLADETLALTRTGYGQINLYATLLGAVFSFGCGWLIDRVGLRTVTTGTFLALGLSTLLMCLAQSSGLLFLGVLLTRGFGQSALSVVSISLVGRWMPQRSHAGMAVMTVLMTILFMTVFIICKEFADANWRTLWSAIGLSVLALAVPAWLIVRDPQIVEVNAEHAAHIRASLGGYRWQEALMTPAFWALSGSICLFSFTTSGLSLFNESILLRQNLNSQAYYDSLAIGAMVGLLGNMTAGLLSAWVSPTRIASAAMLLLSGSLGFLTFVQNYQGMVVFASLNAFAVGMLTVVFFSSWVALYGLRDLGKINGLAQMLTVLASAFGPLVFAQAFVMLESYRPLLWALAGLSLGMSAWAFVVRLPESSSSERV